MFSKNILVFFLVHLTLNLTYGQKDKKFFRNDYQYLEATESFYKISSLPKIFVDAKRACALEGAILWFPDNQDEADAVISHWNSTQPTWWTLNVGLSDLLVRGRFETIDGKRVEDVYHNWKIGEPNNFQGTEQCIILYANGQMVDIPCDRKNPFICKKSLQSLEWDQHCNIPDLDIRGATINERFMEIASLGIPTQTIAAVTQSFEVNIGYSYNERNGRCYKLHSTALNWTDAYNVCSSEQSYLKVVNDWLEVDDLVKLAEAGPKDLPSRSYLRGMYHVGFHNLYNDGWSTVKGAAINDTVPWWGNQPTGGSHDQCGSMFYTGRLTQIDCSLKSLFICEHEVDLSFLNEENSTA